MLGPETWRLVANGQVRHGLAMSGPALWGEASCGLVRHGDVWQHSVGLGIVAFRPARSGEAGYGNVPYGGVT